uniref:Uncharacterized protein n=1 Tax=Solanum lycopersicum TaxID=4081 RepID=A0A3Q7GLZ5_SOLLC
MLLQSSFPLKKFCNSSCTLGILVDPPTRTISWTLSLSTLASLKHISIGSTHFLKSSMFSSSNLARVMLDLKSIPSYSESISTVACSAEERVLFALSQAVLNLLKDLGLLVKSFLCFLLKSRTDQFLVKIFSSKMSISRCRFDLKNSLFNSEKGDIKSTTTKIEDKHILLTYTASFFIQAISNGSSRRLIDNTYDI